MNRFLKMPEPELAQTYMKEALKQAKKAYLLGEVPIGCVIVYEGRIIGRGYKPAATPTRAPLPTRRLLRSKKPAVSSATGGWRTVRSM